MWAMYIFYKKGVVLPVFLYNTNKLNLESEKE